MTRLLLVAAALVAVLAVAGVGAGAEWDVYPGAGTPIQDAIDDAGGGDTIYVHAGTYVENVNVWKRVTLIGDGADVVTVRAADAEDHVFEVTVDRVNISGFAMVGATHDYKAGIHLDNADHCNISENNASDNDRGIFIGDSSNNTLQNNTANSNGWSGVWLWCSNNNPLTNNNATNNGVGIYLSGSSNNMLSDNTVENNAYGICLGYSNNYHNTIANNTFINDGLSVSGERNTVENNIVNGKPLVYLEDMSNFTIQNAGQVILVNCIGITVKNLNLSNVGTGIYLDGTDDCKIVNNTVNSNNMIGIHMWCSKNNTLQNNTVSNNYRGIDFEDLSGTGIYLVHSNNNTLTGNNASNNHCGILVECSTYNRIQNTVANSNNWYGISLWSSNDNTLIDNGASNNSPGIYLWSLCNNNTIFHNNLVNNTLANASDEGGVNQWDSGSAGNYYSDYTGADNNTDGIGDTPYPIPGGSSVDRYPLMHPWTGDTPQKGDLNGDNRITPADAAIALRIAASGGWDADADVSRDGSVTSLDALMILQAAAGTIEL
jgi:parallel beta-helix repeat protein